MMRKLENSINNVKENLYKLKITKKYREIMYCIKLT